MHSEQRVLIRVHHRVNRAEMFGQIFGGGFAHMTNAERKNKAMQLCVFDLFKLGHDTRRRLVAHAIQTRELRLRQREQICSFMH